LECEPCSHSLHLLDPVENLTERPFYVNAEKVQNGVIPAGSSVVGGIVDLHPHYTDELSGDRDSLFDEAKEDPSAQLASSASTPSFYDSTCHRRWIRSNHIGQMKFDIHGTSSSSPGNSD